jgi:hypothetical protein
VVTHCKVEKVGNSLGQQKLSCRLDQLSNRSVPSKVSDSSPG